jgi:hypothetical protein
MHNVYESLPHVYICIVQDPWTVALNQPVLLFRWRNLHQNWKMFLLCRVVSKSTECPNKYVQISTIWRRMRTKQRKMCITGRLIRIHTAYLFEGRYVFHDPTMMRPLKRNGHPIS